MLVLLTIILLSLVVTIVPLFISILTIVATKSVIVISQDSLVIADICRKSDYELTIYIKTSEEPKLFDPIHFGSCLWKLIYKNRTVCERINNRLLNDYSLPQCQMHTRPRLLFLMLLMGINIQLDTYIKETYIKETSK